MERQTRIKIALPDIVGLLSGPGRKIYKRAELEEILAKNRDSWRLAKSLSTNKFIEFLLSETKLKQVELKFPNRREVRFSWGDVSAYELALSLKAGSYLTHFTAMYINDLTEQVPKTIYVNQEQPRPQRREGNLEQDRIDNAFKNKVRVSHEVAEFASHNICVLHGMNTDGLGVVEVDGPEAELVRVTNIERTLIDITVRPVYAGGIFAVLDAYKLASGKVSINRLAAMLAKLDYTYPYHQAVGFYLERSGAYNESAIRLLTKFPIKYQFYLLHNMKETDYSPEWKLHFPKGF